MCKTHQFIGYKIFTIVEFNEANTLVKGVGVELDGAGGLTDGKTALMQKTKNQVQLRNYAERGKDDNLGIFDPKETLTPSPLIDILHRLLWLAENKPGDISDYIAQAQPDASQLRLVAQALSGRALTPNAGEEISTQRTEEQQAIDTLLASWKRIIEENLFTQKK